MPTTNDVLPVRGPGVAPRRAAGAVLALLALGGVAACASTQGRLERGLLQAGVPPQRSECMARHLATKLSTSQLRRLSKVQHLTRDNPESKGVERFLVNAQALGDPRIVTVTSAVALGCAMVAPDAASQATRQGAPLIPAADLSGGVGHATQMCCLVRTAARP